MTDEITGIAVDPEDDGTVYYATPSAVYKSTDYGERFIPLPENPGGAGPGNVEIVTLDVASMGERNVVAVGTSDTDISEYGGVYLLEKDETVFPS